MQTEVGQGFGQQGLGHPPHHGQAAHPGHGRGLEAGEHGAEGGIDGIRADLADPVPGTGDMVTIPMSVDGVDTCIFRVIATLKEE